jgi:rhamnose utilization protein RhaD (predicted bifunctional aldolase and dehydrogenase)/NAD(P)-dependent dehydrogenase (short-subunit alcohol dehydrogenase family)
MKASSCPRRCTGWPARPTRRIFLRMTSTSADPLDTLVHLSHLLGGDIRLVQPGGGNTSIKLGDALLVKGSGTDLRTIGRDGFTRLSLARLAPLGEAETLSDADMMRFMAGCMLSDGPAPSVETPLHSLLPYRVIAHTHDVATMSLTNVADGTAERVVRELFEGAITYVPYSRPGFPLARAVSGMVNRIPPDAIGLALAHHGLVVWGDDAEQAHRRLLQVVGQIDEYIATWRRGRLRGSAAGGPRTRAAASTQGRASRGTSPGNVPIGVSSSGSSPGERRRLAEVVLPAVRGALSAPDRVVLHYDDSDEILARLAGEDTRELSGRGMATPEHVLRAGRLPVWLDLDLSASSDALVAQARSGLAAARAEYEAYHARNAVSGERPLDDWAKVVLVPGLGLITAFTDKRSAVTANLCYRATLEAIEGAEVVDHFQFLPEADVFEFEHWPLERRKVEESIARERATREIPRHVVVVIGGGSGIGQAAARRFAEEGAHVVVADLDGGRAEQVAADLAGRLPGRLIGAAADVRDDTSLDTLFHRTVLEFGGLDCLFYTAGLPPRFAPVTDIRREDLQRQLDVHYLGAVAAIGRAAAIMKRQGIGGSIVASVSKAAVVPGREAVAYAGSKAALLQALRVAAVELGPHGIRVNAINADQIDTPLFRSFVRERAASRGVTEAEQLEAYRKRNLMGAGLIPAEAVADLAVLMASDRFRFTTGDFITVDGGLPEAFPR